MTAVLGRELVVERQVAAQVVGEPVTDTDADHAGVVQRLVLELQGTILGAGVLIHLVADVTAKVPAALDDGNFRDMLNHRDRHVCGMDG